MKRINYFDDKYPPERKLLFMNNDFRTYPLVVVYSWNYDENYLLSIKESGKHYYYYIISKEDMIKGKFDKDINWEQMLQNASEVKIWKAVIYSMRLTKVLLESVLPQPIETALDNKTIEERMFPFSYLVFRSDEIPEMIGRIIRFLLIDDFKGKIQSMTSFYQRFKSLRSK